jgi:hypothetical protein
MKLVYIGNTPTIQLLYKPTESDKKSSVTGLIHLGN